MIDFWKESKKEAIRKAAYIYDPKINFEDIEKMIEAQKPISERPQQKKQIQQTLF